MRTEKELLENAVALLKVATCPNCDGSGSTAVQTSSRQFVTRDMASDACCPEMEGSLYSDDEWEQQQCQWCDEKNRLIAETVAAMPNNRI
jgi:DnaJ-class molecular chaperone